LATPASWTAQALRNPGQREVSATRADERPHVELGSVVAAAFVLEAAPAVVEAPDMDFPTKIPSLAQRLDGHGLSPALLKCSIEQTENTQSRFFLIAALLNFLNF
jgi:hypothetical protein